MRLTTAVLIASFAASPAAFAAQPAPFCHEIHLHADDDALTNGVQLVEFVKSIKDASATRPYVIHLEAGTYAVSTSINLLPYISLKGAGMTATILEAANSSVRTVLFFQDQLAAGYVQTPSNESLSDLTIKGVQTLSVTVNGLFTMDHVQLIPTVAGGDSALDLLTAESHVFITDSLIGLLDLASPPLTITGPTAISSFTGSEIDFIGSHDLLWST